jgi:hypothetical protein
MKLKDRVKELSHTSGSGPFRLDGAVNGFTSFSNVYSINDVVYYAITDGSDYEIGSGQYVTITGNDHITRYPFYSTNANGLVDFGPGVKEVFVTYPGVKSVFTAAGYRNHQSPQSSGVAFWGSDQILDYDNQLVWDASNDRLGISKTPNYKLDINGVANASGIIIGSSGVLFSGIYGYSGGRQLEPFMRNELDSTTFTDAVFSLSGIVSQRFLFKKQSAGLVFAGPPSGCLSPGCSPDYPSFRAINYQDIANIKDIAGTGLTYADNKIRTSGIATFSRVEFHPPSMPGTEEQISIGGGSRFEIGGNFHSNISIGIRASSGVAYSYRTIAIGRNAGSNFSNLGNSIILGAEAGVQTTGTFLVGIGEESSSQSTLLYGSNYIGYLSGKSSISGVRVNAIGWGAAQSSINSEQSNFLGYISGSSSSGVKYCNIIGDSAGQNSSGLLYTNLIGSSAGLLSSGSYGNYIGDGAGANSSSNYSTFIGYKAGIGVNGDYNIIIKNTATVDNGASWAANNDYILDIGNTITGITDSGTIRIGATGTYSEIDDITLSVKSKYDIPAFKTYRSPSVNSPQIISDNGGNNTIVNSRGFLTIPIFSNYANATGILESASATNSGVIFFAAAESRIYLSTGYSWKFVSFT